MKGPLFYSKILLFGEYGIIKDSKGLSIPYNFYNGALIMEKSDDDSARKSNESLCKFADYLDSLQNEQPNLVSFDIDRLNSDVAAGMFLIVVFHKDMELGVAVLWWLLYMINMHIIK